MIAARRMPRIARPVYDLLAAWWRVDQIRTSPQDGILLRLEEDALLEIEGDVVQVHARSVRRRGEETRIVYDCSVDGHDAQLLVSFTDPQQTPTVIWLQNDVDVRQRLTPNDITVFRTSR